MRSGTVWTVAGPIADPDKDGLAKQYPVELDTNQTSNYPGIGWGGRTVSRGLPAPTGTNVEISLASVFEAD